MRMFVALTLLTVFTPTSFAQTNNQERGTATFDPGDQSNVPKMYQLTRHSFPYTVTFKKRYRLSKYELYHVTFPSPVKSPHKENNTVHATYYRPIGMKNFPCTVVLHITGGDQSESKAISAYLAKQGIGALLVQMAYYGPRRPPGTRLKLLSYDIKRTTNAVRQTVLDIRRAAAWMASRDEIDSKQLGVLGTSLGGFMAALSAEMEPKFKKVVVLLAGGGFIDAYYDHPKAKPVVMLWELAGGTKEKAKRSLAPYDPITCAANLKNRDLLMVSAKRDEIVPPKMATALWNASGRQRIIWLNTTHYGAALFLATGLPKIRRHILGK